jgi:RNA polymerase sigma factor (sigma-70 family)
LQYVKQKEDADEIVNDAFLSIWEKRDELDLNISLKAYLYTIVKNKSLNHLKKRNILLETEDSEAYHISSDYTSPIQKLENKELETLIFKCIEKLPPKCKQIFVFE